MNLPRLFGELKRRNVYKVAIAYCVVAWLLIQIATQVFPFFDVPNWCVRLVVLLLALGFPVSLIFAWAFELTPQGLKRTDDVPPSQSIARSTGRKLDFLIIGVLLGVIAFLLVNRWHTEPRAIAPGQPAPEKSIAVLPFQNMSEEKETAFFADGVQDDLVTALSKIADLKVISRTSVMNYRAGESRDLSEIREALGVAHVVEGSVRRSHGTVRVTAQLIDARTKVQLWAERYDRELADIFAIQSDIAQSIADQLRAKLSSKEQAQIQAPPTQNIGAYDLYLRAKAVSRSAVDGRWEVIEQRIRLLSDAVARDPQFVAAYCQLARAHLAAYWFHHDHTPARLAAAKNALDTAARLRPDDGDVHLARARYHYWGSRDYEAALAELELAGRALPNEPEVVYFKSLIERRRGQWEESLRHNNDAAKMDPRNVNMLDNLATTQIALRRYPEAAQVLEQVLVWRADDFNVRLTRAWIDIFAAADLRALEAAVSGQFARTASADQVASARMHLALMRRDYHAAEKALAGYGAAELRPELTDVAYVAPREWYEAIIARSLGDSDRAGAAFLAAHARASATLERRSGDPRAMMMIAEIDARLGRKAEAIRGAERAAELLSIAHDALDGPIILRRLAGVYAQTGEIGHALARLEKAAHMPNGGHYGSLQLDEVWDPLRNESRFGEIVANLAPKGRSR